MEWGRPDTEPRALPKALWLAALWAADTPNGYNIPKTLRKASNTK
jgi:hypothetical protein